MGIADIFWIYFVLMSLQPVISQRLLEWKRTDLLRRLEKQTGSRVIALVHRQETMSLLGFPIVRYINIEDSEEILRAIKLTDKTVPINLILHTPGGLVLAARQIAHALGRHEAKVTVFVPHYAMSGGTLISLAADEIVMDPNAVLGPVDPQLNEYPAASILRAVSQKDKNEIDDRTLILADISEKAIVQLKDAVRKILKQKMDGAKADVLAETLATGTWTHDYPLTYDELSEMGLPVSTDMPPDVYEFMELFPQPKKKIPSVQYIPVPTRQPADRGQ
ncbi:MAG TPA: ATP-dependent Clp protease proteolytic subunit [Pyrinomonadaceae bacterium]|nr:ATP-dependent Clp protease proteolytic subunit [Pyrinomonadaceae bacterium]